MCFACSSIIALLYQFAHVERNVKPSTGVSPERLDKFVFLEFRLIVVRAGHTAHVKTDALTYATRAAAAGHVQMINPGDDAPASGSPFSHSLSAPSRHTTAIECVRRGIAHAGASVGRRCDAEASSISLKSRSSQSLCFLRNVTVNRTLLGERGAIDGGRRERERERRNNNSVAAISVHAGCRHRTVSDDNRLAQEVISPLRHIRGVKRAAVK